MRLTPPVLADMMQAYKTTGLLQAGIELEVFTALAGGRSSAATVAEKMGVDERPTRLLLNGLAALGLVASDGTDYWLPEGAELLVKGSPMYVGDMAKVMASDWEWDAIKRLPEAVRSGGPVVDKHAETPGFGYWEDFAQYAVAVARPMAEKAAEVLRPWASERPTLEILDVACGHGLYGFTLARHQPHARVWSLDWDNVLPIARAHAERMGVADRMREIAGDMFEVELGGPYDVVMITNVLHHFSEARGIDLLRRARGVLKPDGKLMLVGFTVNDGPPIDDPAPHLFSILMLVWTAKGEVHSVAAYDGMLEASSFTPATVTGVPPLPLKILVADPA